MDTSPHGKFTPKEHAAFAPGGMYSTDKKRADAPASNFLLPAERKYPYKVNGVISCDLLKAAISRSKQNNEMGVHKKAMDLYDTHCEPADSESESPGEL